MGDDVAALERGNRAELCPPNDAMVGSLVATVASQAQTIREQAETIRNITTPREIGAELTVRELWDAYARTMAHRSWWSKMGYLMRDCLAEFGERKALSLRPSEWVTFRNEKLGRLKAGTRTCVLVRMSACFNWAVTDGLIARNPWLAAKPEPKHNRTTVIAHRDESMIVGKLPLWAASLVVVKTESGMRIGELLGLLWAEVDLEHSVVHLPAERTKTKQARDVKLSERACSALRMLERKGPFVFPSPKCHGKPYAYHTFLSLWHQAADGVAPAPGDDRVVPHSCRHTAGTRMSGLGVPLPTIARQLGHSHIQTTAKYIHPGEADLLDLKARLDGGEMSAGRHGPAATGRASSAPRIRRGRA